MFPYVNAEEMYLPCTVVMVYDLSPYLKQAYSKGNAEV